MWKDSRTNKPNCNSASRYAVIVNDSGFVYSGYAMWIPEAGYTNGKWHEVETKNGNKLGGEVLYWIDYPEMPKDIIYYGN